MNSYPVGTKVRVTATFAFNGANADPTRVVCRVKGPDGRVATYGPVWAAGMHPNPGVYQYDVATPLPGVYTYRFEGVGDGGVSNFLDVADEATFYVEPSAILGN